MICTAHQILFELSIQEG